MPRLVEIGCDCLVIVTAGINVAEIQAISLVLAGRSGSHHTREVGGSSPSSPIVSPYYLVRRTETARCEWSVKAHCFTPLTHHPFAMPAG
jgi:hypothetical protein